MRDANRSEESSKGHPMMQVDPIKTARILIVDDQEVNVHFLEGTLRWVAGNTNFKSTTNPREVEALITEFEPDLILLDLHMPERDGFMVMEDLKQTLPADAFLPILVLTADVTPEAKQRALAGGAKDFLSKPFDTTEVLLRSNNLLQTRLLHLELANQNQILEVKVQERTHDLQKANEDLQAAHRDLEDAHIEMLERMALAAEYRDDDTGEHTKRVGQVSAFLGRAMRLAQDQVMLIRRAAPLHDVGKIAIP
ncbi:MAG: response regulator, partial [Bacillati bacterium ANGP1]